MYPSQTKFRHGFATSTHELHHLTSNRIDSARKICLKTCKNIFRVQGLHLVILLATAGSIYAVSREHEIGDCVHHLLRQPLNRSAPEIGFLRFKVIISFPGLILHEVP